MPEPWSTRSKHSGRLRRVLVVGAAAMLLAGCSPKGQVNSDGAFAGTVSRVWEDGLNLAIEGGNTIRVDTWSVCGDFTATSIASGDAIQVWATRDLFSYEAWQIQNADGEPAC